MKRLALILAVSWLAAIPSAKAGELDSEFGGKAKVSAPAPVLEKSSASSSELDAESPDQACHRWRRGYYGFRGYGYGYPGFGFGFGFGYGRGYYGYGYGRGFGYGRWRW